MRGWGFGSFTAIVALELSPVFFFLSRPLSSPALPFVSFFIFDQTTSQFPPFELQPWVLAVVVRLSHRTSSPASFGIFHRNLARSSKARPRLTTFSLSLPPSIFYLPLRH
ncbi:hypothetical protein M011DRAFT_174404 [Sporormia fimetaria CBS 119925]|uniref:Uncharacterized protein n=1 Tax=Sporormia fimetaria CBS 119925 TaxID=1340428 RepID=A0A6A6VIX1_9PLEO|nr:hypothetical protein M011DRAFT_174404 [Sporormia fimetaria CBS 119925]